MGKFLTSNDTPIAGHGKFETSAGGVKLDPRMLSILQQAAAVSPYNVVAFSGVQARTAGTTNHPSGHAIDVYLQDPATGKLLTNYSGSGFAKSGSASQNYPAYEQFAQTARVVQQKVAPELNGTFRWGGYFTPGNGNKAGADLMHFDDNPKLGGAMGGGTWEKGLSPTYAKLYGVPASGGLDANPQIAQAYAAGTPLPPAVKAINDATTQSAPSPMPGRPSALSGPQAQGGSNVKLASGKSIATGTYPSSDGTHQVSITDDGHGNAVVTKLQNPGEIPGVIDPLHENHSIAGTIVHNTIQDMANSGAGKAVQAAVPAVQQAASNATNAFNSAAPGVSSAIGNAFNSGINGLGSLFGGGSPSPAPTTPSLGATGTAGAGTGASGSATPPVNYLSPTTTYSQQQMTSANPEYEKYIQAQGADDIGKGPGTFGDLTSLANSGTPPANAFTGSKTVTTTQQVAHPSDAVRQVQQQLGINADGLYGAQTTQAVKDFQQAHGLTVDGIVGPQTLGALNGTPAPAPAPVAAPVAAPAPAAPVGGNAFVQSVSGGPGRHDSHGWGVNAQGHIVAE